ncbi:hypothetical protein QM012_003741 [Aureobasidium pullulans]|uniref:Autophagy-related protein 11 n=1 Tax=Aureobasidium pullulans TaxID=5580 RepID=A0ABR0T7S3_AURPU
MAEHNQNKHDIHPDIDATHKLDHVASNAQRDVIHQVNDLKAKNTSSLKHLVRKYADANKHLAECNHHYLQISQYRFVFTAGSSLILTRPDGSINHFNSAKISLAMKLLEFDRKRAASLRAFYDAQKGYFDLLDKMKETEVKIQQLLGSITKDGGEEHDEMQESKKRIASLEETRAQMMESWLELLEAFV